MTRGDATRCLVAGSSGRCRRSGLTLAEVVVSSLLVGLLLVSALQSSAGVVRNWSAATDAYRMAHLADQMVSEIVQHTYEDPNGSPVFGLEAGEGATVRESWNDTDDYHGWTASPPRERDGTVMSEFSGWTRAVSVRLATVSDPALTPGADEGLKLVEVTVTSPSGASFVRSALRSRWGQLDQTPTIDATWVTSVASSLTLSDGTKSSAGSSLPNSVEDTP